RNTLQIEARTLLKEIVFPQIRTLIAKLLEHISQIESNISDLGRYFSDNVTRLKNLPSYLYDAGGYELVNKTFINVNVSKFYDGLGGKETAAKKAFEQFIGRFKNLDAFVSAEHDHISKFLKDSGALNAKNFFYNLNVYDIFNQTFSTNKQKTEIISNIIERSCLSIKITGEGDENVPKVKYICGNDTRLVDWAVKKANEIDRRGGDWKAHKDENLPEGLSFFQYRTNISIAQLMKDTSATARLPSDSNELIRIGENPIISLMPDPESYKDGKTDSRMDMIIAQGIAAGVIIENIGNFEFHKAFSEPMIMGKTIEDVRKYLARNYSHIVYICREFAKSLIADDSQTLRLLKSDKLTPTFGEKTVQNTLTTALQLIPYLKKIRKDNYATE
ncbi:MAG: hypothetical protein ABFD79_10935, partial [Phycisphaerales bacterium]